MQNKIEKIAALIDISQLQEKKLKWWIAENRDTKTTVSFMAIGFWAGRLMATRLEAVELFGEAWQSLA